MVLLPGVRTFLLSATHAPTPAAAHKTMCPQAPPTGEEVAAARTPDRHLEDLIPRGKEQVVFKATDMALQGLPIIAQ